jgi:hypothetical protein
MTNERPGKSNLFLPFINIIRALTGTRSAESISDNPIVAEIEAYLSANYTTIEQDGELTVTLKVYPQDNCRIEVECGEQSLPTNDQYRVFIFTLSKSYLDNSISVSNNGVNAHVRRSDNQVGENILTRTMRFVNDLKPAAEQPTKDSLSFAISRELVEDEQRLKEFIEDQIKQHLETLKNDSESQLNLTIAVPTDDVSSIFIPFSIIKLSNNYYVVNTCDSSENLDQVIEIIISDIRLVENGQYDF